MAALEDAWRSDFPLIADGDIVYLDNAASTQKPRQVLEALDTYYRTTNANVHRGVHKLSDRATTQFEAARERVARFIGASDSASVIWTRGTTEAINLVALAFAPTVLDESSNVVISVMEHHSNIVPWQQACLASGAELRAIRLTASGELDLDDAAAKIDENTTIIAIGHASNALGTINPLEHLKSLGRNAYLVVDGAQGAPHLPIDVEAMGCDFYAFSGHKIYGPTGIGVLYGRPDLLRAMPPWQTGGEMIEHVSIEQTTFADLPHRFEAGTPDISGAIGLAAAVDYFDSFPLAAVDTHEQNLLSAATSGLQQIEGVEIVGTARNKVPVVSFTMQGAHPHDVGTLLDQQDVAVRTGHHCAMPLMESLGISGTVRASFSLYNSAADVDRLIAAVQKARTFL